MTTPAGEWHGEDCRPGGAAPGGAQRRAPSAPHSREHHQGANGVHQEVSG